MPYTSNLGSLRSSNEFGILRSTHEAQRCRARRRARRYKHVHALFQRLLVHLRHVIHQPRGGVELLEAHDALEMPRLLVAHQDLFTLERAVTVKAPNGGLLLLLTLLPPPHGARSLTLTKRPPCHGHCRQSNPQRHESMAVQERRRSTNHLILCISPLEIRMLRGARLVAAPARCHLPRSLGRSQQPWAKCTCRNAV